MRAAGWKVRAVVRDQSTLRAEQLAATGVERSVETSPTAHRFVRHSRGRQRLQRSTEFRTTGPADVRRIRGRRRHHGGRPGARDRG
ncbi:NmrA family NAD(P)-binding protein [Gordonia otitidis]|nr:NmrA family NAD(P)-binding protein [Gordonia otitidis]